MAVLIEGISVIVRFETVSKKFAGLTVRNVEVIKQGYPPWFAPVCRLCHIPYLGLKFNYLRSLSAN